MKFKKPEINEVNMFYYALYSDIYDGYDRTCCKGRAQKHLGLVR